MTPEQWNIVKGLFADAMQRPEGARLAWAEANAAGHGPVVASELLLLIRGDAAASECLEDPAAAVGLHDDAPTPNHLLESPPPLSIGPYRVVRTLGHGQSSVVYEAEQATLERRVAVKVLTSLHHDGIASRRFAREAKTLALLDHPDIAHVFETGLALLPEGRNVPYIAMELVRGGPINEVAAALPPRSIVELVCRVCEAIEHAHQRGVVHRDLKPSHVLVNLEHERPLLKIIDFGLAQFLDADRGTVTSANSFAGTLAYMPPERAAAEGGGAAAGTDTRGDIYAIGAVLYHTLTGSPPFDFTGRSAVEALRQLEREEPVPARTLCPAAAGDLDVIVAKAMHKDPSLRYQSASELRADLQRWLDHQVVLARRPTAGYVVSRFIRRHRVFSAAALATTLAAAAAVMALAVSNQREREAHEDATQMAAILLGHVTAIADQAGAGPRRREILEGLRGPLTRFAARYPDDVALQPDFARLLGELGDLETERGQWQQALWLFKEAARIRRSLRNAQPGEPVPAAELSIALVRLGDASGQVGARQDQETLYAEAMQIDEELFRQYPDVARYTSQLAYSCERTGHLALARGDVDAAEALIQRQVKLAAGLVVRASPDRMVAERWALASARGSLASVLAAHNDPGGAHEQREFLLADTQWLREQEPTSRRFAMLQIGVSLALGQEETWLDHADVGLAHYQRAVDVAELLAKDDSTDAGVLQLYSIATQGLAQAYLKYHRPETLEAGARMVAAARAYERLVPQDRERLRDALESMVMICAASGDAAGEAAARKELGTR